MSLIPRNDNTRHALQACTLVAALFCGWFTYQAATYSQETEIIIMTPLVQDYVTTWVSGGLRQIVGTYRKDYDTDDEASAAHAAKVAAHLLVFPKDAE